MISKAFEDHRHHRAEGEERRGRPRLISNWHLKEMDRIIKEDGFEAHALLWHDLAYEVGLEGLDSRTIAHAMGNIMSYHKCIACQKKWCNKKLAKDRKAWAELMKDRYPEPSDWYRVRFSDEVHWAIGPQGSIYIREEKDDREKVLKRVHAWAAIGHNFKSDLTFYEIKSNTNGKMTQRAYIDQFLEPVVKPWLERGDDFVLEEDGNSGHGPG
ncbi:hypothetical protein EK21DRAFT_89559 [Setomelanomma holmii]|uniref:Uncharacterized protein n=1 Tax=Setomelanomma holmii TaxID=210430 RepID=A0A9P4H7Y7_9PLEO|nr:hypothetical protein EK21DRAFT_89559 [Setomelanomma holmii]